MNIEEAKEELRHTVEAYLKKKMENIALHRSGKDRSFDGTSGNR